MLNRIAVFLILLGTVSVHAQRRVKKNTPPQPEASSPPTSPAGESEINSIDMLTGISPSYGVGNQIEDPIVDPAIDPIDDYFRTHITSGTSSLRPWGVAYQRFPGALFSEHMLFNSLNLGITRNIQVGTVPLMYLTKPMVKNFNGKFVTSKPVRTGRSRFYFGAGSSTFSVSIKHDPFREKDGSVRSETEVVYVFLSGMVTWVTPLEWLSFSQELSYNTVGTNSDAVNEELKTSSHPVDMMLDMGLRYSPNFFHTFGFGWNRSHSFDALNGRKMFGFGNSITWAPYYRYLSSLSVGVHYFPQKNKPYFLLGAGF